MKRLIYPIFIMCLFLSIQGCKATPIERLVQAETAYVEAAEFAISLNDADKLVGNEWEIAKDAIILADAFFEKVDRNIGLTEEEFFTAIGLSNMILTIVHRVEESL